ncbi:MAG: IMP dehydrogenase [archaeon]
MKPKTLKTGLTFDDVLLVPKKSDVLPGDVDVSTRLTKNLMLSIPIISAAMDTVTESRLAIALAKEGGIGIVHRNMPIGTQIDEIIRVKKASSWIIHDPVSVAPAETVEKARSIMQEHGVNGLPVTTGSKLVGILTRRDLRFNRDKNQKVSDVMTKKVITVNENISVDEAIRLLDKNRIEKLPVVDRRNNLTGLITVKDIENKEKFPNACKDKEGRLKVGAAVGPFDMDRVDALVKADVDLIGVDTAHGHSANVIRAVKAIKKQYDVDVAAGNVATASATADLVSAGADIIKVGVGPGAICTTRIITGVGVPQVSAIMDCYDAAPNVGIVADGGIRYSGDIAKAVAAGASAVMIGSLFAGTDETPGRTVFVQGRKFKRYRGMGSVGAMEAGSKDRYFLHKSSKPVPEGIEGIVPYRGNLPELVYQLVGGLRSAMGYCGAGSIEELRKKAELMKITDASLRESHPHDITITEEAPNYYIMRGP